MVAQEAAEQQTLDQVALMFLVKVIQVAEEDLEVGLLAEVAEHLVQEVQHLMRLQVVQEMADRQYQILYLDRLTATAVAVEEEIEPHIQHLQAEEQELVAAELDLME